MDKATLKIIILSAVFFLMFGGYLIWEIAFNNRIVPEKEIKSEILKMEIIPSEKTDAGIFYQEGAKAVVLGVNLSKVEFYQKEGDFAVVGKKTETQNGKEKWESDFLPTGKLFVNFCAVGSDSKNNEIGEVCLSDVKGLTEEEVRKAEQKAKNKVMLEECLAAVGEKYSKILEDYFNLCAQSAGESESAIMSCMERTEEKEAGLKPQIKNSEDACYRKYPI